jgi:hypothetical protein
VELGGVGNTVGGYDHTLEVEARLPVIFMSGFMRS